MCDHHPTFTRRKALHLLSTAGFMGVGSMMMGINACESTDESPTPDPGTTPTATPEPTPGPTPSTCTEIPSETAGPYPDKTGMVDDEVWYRQDITEGKTGVPLTLVLTVVDVSDKCAFVKDATVEIWHCDAAGLYSEYSQPGYDGTGTTFLRGLQVTGSAGQVTFKTVYPGWYQGRVTHIHAQVYVNGTVVKVTQFAFPENITKQVYSVAPYASKGQNSLTNSSDNVFSDGTTYEMLSVTGSTSAGYVASLTVGLK